MRLLPFLALLALAAACQQSPDFAQALGVAYAPPGGLGTPEVWQEASSSPQARRSGVRFSGGLELLSLPGLALPVSSEAEAVLAAAGQPVPGRRLSQQEGTLAPGPVLRAEFKEGTRRTLLYYLPLKGRGLLVRYSAPEADYGRGAAAVERSLGTLQAVH